jgi:predicted phage tail protein
MRPNFDGRSLAATTERHLRVPARCRPRAIASTAVARGLSSRHHAGNKRVDVATVVPVLALSHQTGVTLAEVGFLLILFAGVWLVSAEIPVFKMRTARTIVAGVALALAGVLLIIATHWGHFG